MLSREAKKELNELFWSSFKKVIIKERSSNGRKINWLNYPSDVKDVYIRLKADAKTARLSMDIQPKDDGVRSIIWEQMTELKKVLEDEMGSSTNWIEHVTAFDGRVYSQIYWELEGVNFYNQQDWPLIFDFFKERMLHFDQFYQEFKDILIALTK